MKKTLDFLAVASIMIIAVACAKEQNQIDTREAELVTIKLKVNTDTKSQLENDFKTVKWSAGDKISVLNPASSTVQPTGYNINTTDNTVTIQLPAGATSFYGLYPYNAAATIASNKITTTLPSEQIAVKGNIPNNANVSIGYANKTDASIVFKNVGAILSFTLDYNDIKSVSFSGNNNESVAGTINITYPAAGTPSVAFTSKSSKTITLKTSDGSSLEKGKKYYMVVAPQTFSKGITLTLCNSAGKVAAKSSSTSTTISRNGNLSLGTINGMTFKHDLHMLYQAGKDVTIAGKVYNRANNGDAVLLDSDVQPDLYATVSGKEGVFFLKGNANFTNSRNLIIGKDLVISSNDPEKPVNYVPTKQWSIRKGSITMNNIKIDLTGITNYLINNTATVSDDFSAIVFDKCNFTNIKCNILNANNRKDVGITTISLTNCKIRIISGKPLFNAFKCSKLYKYKNIIFENNVFYSASAVNSQVFNYNNKITQNNAETWDCSISMKNNIFYNIYSTNGLIRHYIVASLTSGHNIYNTSNCGSGNGSKSFYIFGDKPGTAIISNTKDVLKTTAGNKWSYNGKGIWNPKGITNLLPIEESEIFDSFNTTTGEYVLKTGYENYGPQN